MQSVKGEESINLDKVKIDLIKATEKEKSTQNLCIAAQMMATYHLPYRFYPLLCTTIHVMSANSETNLPYLLGNNNQSYNVVPKAQYACYEACVDKMKADRIVPLLATKQSPRFQICADRGTSYKDCSRQAIVETNIGPDGYSHEYLVSVAGISDSTSNGAAEHFTKYTSKILDTNQIAVISTDGAATYTGKNKGMFQLLKANRHFYNEKVLFLPDLCHRAERLLANNNPAWLEDTIDQCDKLISKFNSSPLLRQALIKFESVEKGIKLFAMEGTCDTRYAEYMHKSIHSLLSNYDILHIALPEIKTSNEFDCKTRQRAENMLQIMSDPSFVAKLLLADNVYMHVEVMEKEAQNSCFGAFEYTRITTSLKSALRSKLAKADKNALKIITSGVFNHEYVANRKTHKFTVNLHSQESEFHKQVKHSYEKWVSEILSDFDKYIEIPTVIDKAVKVFTLSENIPMSERTEDLRQFMEMVNTNFLPCGDYCKGLQSCTCLGNKLHSFLSNVQEQVKIKHEEIWSQNTSTEHSSQYPEMQNNIHYNYSTIFAYYLAEKNSNVIDKLKITNILRAIEIVQLLKASQSSTERVFSIVSKVVKGRYENRYRLDGVSATTDKLDNLDKSNDGRDYVAAAVFLSLNSNIVTLDAGLARQKFLTARHQEALLSSKPSCTIGKTVKTTLKKLKIPLTAAKKKTKTLPLNRIRQSYSTDSMETEVQDAEPVIDIMYSDTSDPAQDAEHTSEQWDSMIMINNPDIKESNSVTDVDICKYSSPNVSHGEAMEVIEYRDAELTLEQWDSMVIHHHPDISQSASVIGVNICEYSLPTGVNIGLCDNSLPKEVNICDYSLPEESNNESMEINEHKQNLMSYQSDYKQKNKHVDYMHVQSYQNKRKTKSPLKVSGKLNWVDLSHTRKRVIDIWAKFKKDKAFNSRIMEKLKRFRKLDITDEKIELNVKDDKVDSCKPLMPVDDKMKPVLMLRDGRLLNRQDKASVVEENQWLEQNVVTGFLSCFQENHILTLGDNDWNLIAEGSLPRTEIIDWKLIKQVLVGRHEPQHFVLYFFDMASFNFFYLNTLRQAKDIQLGRPALFWNSGMHS